MSERSRGALIAVLWNWVAFAAVAAWFGHDLRIYPTPGLAQQLSVSHPAVPDSFHVLIAAGSVGLAATAIAAVVFAIDAARHASRSRRTSTFGLMAVPVLVAAVWVGGVRLIPAGGYSAGHIALVLAWLLTGVAGVAGSTQAVVTVIKRTDFDDRTWRVGCAAAAAVVAAMVVATVATITWGVAVRSGLPRYGDGSGSLIVTAIMAVTTVRALLALLGVRREPVAVGASATGNSPVA